MAPDRGNGGRSSALRDNAEVAAKPFASQSCDPRGMIDDHSFASGNDLTGDFMTFNDVGLARDTSVTDADAIRWGAWAVAAGLGAVGWALIFLALA